MQQTDMPYWSDRWDLFIADAPAEYRDLIAPMKDALIRAYRVNRYGELRKTLIDAPNKKLGRECLEDFDKASDRMGKAIEKMAEELMEILRLGMMLQEAKE